MLKLAMSFAVAATIALTPAFAQETVADYRKRAEINDDKLNPTVAYTLMLDEISVSDGQFLSPGISADIRRDGSLPTVGVFMAFYGRRAIGSRELRFLIDDELQTIELQNYRFDLEPNGVTEIYAARLKEAHLEAFARADFPSEITFRVAGGNFTVDFQIDKNAINSATEWTEEFK